MEILNPAAIVHIRDARNRPTSHIYLEAQFKSKTQKNSTIRKMLLKRAFKDRFIVAKSKYFTTNRQKNEVRTEFWNIFEQSELRGLEKINWIVIYFSDSNKYKKEIIKKRIGSVHIESKDEAKYFVCDENIKIMQYFSAIIGENRTDAKKLINETIRVIKKSPIKKIFDTEKEELKLVCLFMHIFCLNYFYRCVLKSNKNFIWKLENSRNIYSIKKSNEREYLHIVNNLVKETVEILNDKENMENHKKLLFKNIYSTCKRFQVVNARE